MSETTSNQTESLYLVDSILVEALAKNGGERTTASGILYQEEEKPVNFGVVKGLPSFLTEDKYGNLAAKLDLGYTVFFQASNSYNFIPQSDDTYKLLIIPLHAVDAFFNPKNVE